MGEASTQTLSDQIPAVRAVLLPAASVPGPAPAGNDALLFARFSGSESGHRLILDRNTQAFRDEHFEPVSQEFIRRMLGLGPDADVSPFVNMISGGSSVTCDGPGCGRVIPDGEEFYVDPQDYHVNYCTACGETYNAQFPPQSE